MSEEKIIVGLDIGTTKTACIVGKKAENGKVEILGYGKTVSTGVRRGVVINIAETVTAIKKAVEQASEQSGVDIATVNVGIAGQHIKSLQHKGVLMRNDSDKYITAEELEQMRQDTYKINMMPGEEIIGVHRQETYVDGELSENPIGMLGNKIEANFHVILGQTAAAKNIIRCIKDAGLEMDHMILEPIASAQAVLSEDEKEAGVALVDIGGGTTDIAIFKDKKIFHTAVIPFGGDIITDDICQGCTIIRHYAEEVKTKFGSALASENRDDEVVSIPGIRGRAGKEISFKNLANIIQARLDEIFDYVNLEIQKVNADRKLIAGIVLTGGGALMKHIQMLAEFRTGMPVRIGYPNEHLTSNTNKDLASPMYSTGIGLVIEGIIRNELSEMLQKEKAADNKKETVIEIDTPVSEEVLEEPTDTRNKSGKKKFELRNIGTTLMGKFNTLFTDDSISQ